MQVANWSYWQAMIRTASAVLALTRCPDEGWLSVLNGRGFGMSARSSEGPEGLRGPRLVLRYCGFAVIATIANLAAQRMVFASVAHDIRFGLALIAGTAVGLVLKYVLDKKWIFFDRSRHIANETRTFSLYTLTGIGTTLIFWGMESLFWLLWHTQTMRETGAVLGLTVGYVIKYNLDRRYVFRA